MTTITFPVGAYVPVGIWGVKSAPRLATIEGADLEGTEKQIAWASDLRRAYLSSVLGLAFRTPAQAAAFLAAPAAAAQLDQVAAFVAAENSAKFWIDTRGDVRAVGAAIKARVSA